jgi:diaminopimelate decarboxylase
MTPWHLADEFGTPLYVYDLAAVRRSHRELRAALPRPSALHYSVKANPHPDVAAELCRLGCGAEVSSLGEVSTALRCGFRAGDVVFTGPGKTVPHVRAAVAQGVRRFSAESPVDLETLGALGLVARVDLRCLLRINPDTAVSGMGLSMTGTSSQFGVDASAILARPEAFRSRRGVRVAGLHIYMGTNIESEETLLRQFQSAAALVGEISGALGEPLSEVNLGGGFGAPYGRSAGPQREGGRLGTLGSRLAPVLDRDLPGWRTGRPAVTFESGRYLTAHCGTLVCRVVDVKISKSRTYVVLDTGVNHLGGMAGLRRLPRIVPEVLSPHGDGRTFTDATVVGPLCTPLDVWASGVTVPAVAPGDLVAVPNVGAYGLTASLVGFLGHPCPVEVVVDTDRDEPFVGATRLTLVREPATPADAAPPSGLAEPTPASGLPTATIASHPESQLAGKP